MPPVRTEIKGIPGVEVIRPDVKGDRRGFFLENLIPPGVFREEPTFSDPWNVAYPALSERDASAPPPDWERVAAALA